jgi:hypothetical protein
MIQLQVVAEGLPSPQRGRGGGSEGETALLIQFPKLGSG